MTLLPFLAVLAVTLAWFLLPLLPALRELLRPTDTTPLSVVERDAANLAYFADRFRLWITAQLAGLPLEIPEGDYYGRLPSGTGFVRVRNLPEVLSRGPRPDGAHDRVIVTEAPVTLVGRETFLLEVYATAPWTGGPETTLRALYGTADVRLGSRSTVTRWVHSEGVLLVEDGSLLFGRASSASAIRLGTGVRFERIGAPRIEVGPAHPRGTPEAVERTAWIPPERARTVGDHLHVDGDAELPAGTEHRGDLVVAGTLTIGAEARVEGSVKAHRSIQVGRGGTITGSVVSRTTIKTAGDVAIGGPVIAEDEILLGEGTMVGGPGRETTVVAPLVTLAPGVVVFGQVNAGVSGTT